MGIEVVVDDETGELLGLDITTSESAEEIEPFIREIAEQVEAEVLVSDDFDTYKSVADNVEPAHQIERDCRLLQVLVQVRIRLIFAWEQSVSLLLFPNYQTVTPWPETNSSGPDEWGMLAAV